MILSFKILLAFIIAAYNFSFAQQKIYIQIPKEPVVITADLYFVNDSLPYIILCHQAQFSRGEYLQSALRLCKLGYNCIAIDQRSGNQANGINNETAALVRSLGKPTTTLDAEQDIIAAIDYTYAKNKKDVIILGSSYSASLVLKIGTTNEKVKAIIAFSPGEYFGSKLNLKNVISNLDKPTFITSSKTEALSVTALIKDIKSEKVTQFIPKGEGQHASKSLWTSNPNEGEYWNALMAFLNSIK